MHFFQYSPNEPPKRHHWQTGVDASAHYDWLQLLKPSIQRMRKPKSAKMWRIRHPHNFVCIVRRIRCHPRKLPKRCHETGKADVTARRVPEERIRMGRVCDYCSTAKAVIFCRADSARLCLACDKQVRQLPAPISAKPGLTTGRSEWGKSPSTRRTGARVPVRRDVVNAHSMPLDPSLPTRPLASARNGRFPHHRATPDAFGVSASRRNRRLHFEVFLTRSRYPPSSQVHTANQVARRHVRSWLCDACQNGSAKVRRRPCR